jgi:peptide deformylase
MEINIILYQQTPKLQEIPQEMFGTKKLKEIVNAIYEWLKTNPSGIAVAFNQVSIDGERCMLKGCVKSNGDVFLNPKLELEGVPFYTKEACLTWPGSAISAKRMSKIKVTYKDLEGNEKVEEFDGIDAHILQHEVDHLEGIPEEFLSEHERRTFIKKHNIGRNEPCPCGSGRKFKKCCLDTISNY